MTGAAVTCFVVEEPCFCLPYQHCVFFRLGFEGNPFAWSVNSFSLLWGAFTVLFLFGVTLGSLANSEGIGLFWGRTG